MNVIEGNHIAKDLTHFRCIHHLFEEQVRQRPTATAVVFESQHLTYFDLNRYANKVAHYLQKKGVKPDDLVGIFLYRSIEMLVGILGILKSGGAYVPLDPILPKERIAFMLEDAQLSVLLTHRHLLENLPHYGREVVFLDEEETFASESEKNTISEVTPENLAYVIYTSGSTGRPKGVMVQHCGVSNMVLAQVKFFNVRPESRILQFYSFVFDASVFETFMALLTGATLFLETRDTLMQGPALANLLREEGITSIQLPPSVLELLPSENFPALEVVMVGGEVYPPDLVARWAVGRRLFNVYGPTETTVWATVYERIDDRPKLPIGQPIPNTQIYILDDNQQPVPVGVAGEICIGGVGLARSYLNQPDLTAEKFIPNPFSDQPGARLYRTGDLGRYLPDGNIEFLGRIDHQVKIRGFRIELGEIEWALQSHPSVREAVVVAREDGSGEKQLVAYLVLEEAGVTVKEVRSFLREKLPGYMVPSAFMILDSMPRTPNDKVDRNALPTPDALQREVGEDFVAPRSYMEKVLGTIWAKVLQLDRVGIHDNFLDLGGHSIKATQVVSQIREIFGLEMPLSKFFETKTLMDLAQWLDSLLLKEVRELPQEEAERLVKAEGLLVANAADVSQDGNVSLEEYGLSETKLALLKIRLRGSFKSDLNSRKIPKRLESRKAPLSFAQQRLWLIEQQDVGSTAYTIPFAYQIEGQLDAKVLEQSLREVVRRHEILRTAFVIFNDEPVQIIKQDFTLELPVVNLEHLTTVEREAEVSRIIAEAVRHPFELSTGNLARYLLLRLSQNEHVLLLVMHHIVFDGWSVGVFSRELSALYEAFLTGKPSPLPELAVQYADFAHWQRQWLQGPILESQLSYWKKQLGGKLPVLELTTDYPRPPIKTYAGGRHSFKLSPSLSEALKVLAQRQSVTLFMVLLAAFKVLLYRYTGQQNILVGTAIANRNRQDIENLIGFFVNTLVLRTEISGDSSFLDLLKRVSNVSLDAYDNQDLPFEKLVEQISPERSLSHTPLFQVMFVLQNAAMLSLEIPGLATKIFDIHNGASKFDLQIELVEESEGLTGWFEYNKDLFSSATIERMTGHFLTLLQGIVAAPEQRVADLPILTQKERHQILVEWNDTTEAFPRDKCIHHLFEEQVERSPEAIAVVFEDRKLTYAQLNRLSNQLARYLQKLGVKPDTLVGICLERSIEMVVGLMGILKAGGVFVPIAPDYPEERRNFMLADSGVKEILTQKQLEADFPDCGVRKIFLDFDRAEISKESTDNLTFSLTLENLAYTIYTSGSTGRPKGVMNTHGGVLNRLHWMQSVYQLTEQDRVLQKTPFSFDVSVWEFFWPLMVGARLVLARPGSHKDSTYLAKLIADEKITTLHFVPSMLQLFVEEPNIEYCSSLRRVICSGEALPYELQKRFFNRLNAELHNLYGPTEASIDVTFWKCQRENDNEIVPIGRPIANTQIYILDTNLQPVPVGVAGEICIGGVGLARGYLNQPDLTAEKFIPNPFSEQPGTRLYRTGDLGRYLPNGNIEFLGRIDHQVKIRGFRIELGEIEWALQSHPSVREAVVVAREDSSWEKRLVAYLVAKEAGITVKEVRSFLREKLPDYMMPSFFVKLDSMPLTANGKADRKALPNPYDVQPESEEHYVMPRTPLEQKIAEIWKQVIGMDRVGVHDNFFDLGGHSLLATKVVMRLREAFQIELPVRCLFESPTVESLTRTVEVLRTQGLSALSSESPDLVAEAELEPEFSPAGEPLSNVTDPRSIFLTGATGFLGAFLLYELLKRTNAEIYCLVRSSNTEEARKRIQATLKKYSLWVEDTGCRIKAVVGDLAKPLLGLSPEEFRELATKIDTIYHNGAWVNFIEPYSRLKSTNVLGTKEILRLACQGKVKPMHYIASSSVFGTVGYFKGIKVLKEEDDISLGLGYGFGGYIQSKWVAEKMVWNAQARGLPVTVFRCALVMGHSQTGIGNTKDFPSRLLKSCIELGSFYDLRNKFDNFVPVDFASQAVVHLSLKKECIGKPFHIVNSHHIEYSDFWNLVRAYGYPIEKLSYKNWTKKLLDYIKASQEIPLYALIPLFIEKISPSQLTIVELFQDTPFYDTTNVMEGLSDSSIVCPKIDEALLSTWLSYYVRTGFLKPPSG